MMSPEKLQGVIAAHSRWLCGEYGVTNSWDEAVAAYHAGLGKRSKGFALDYAACVRAVGTTTN